jgi:tRNA G46 methylase TrmB
MSLLNIKLLEQSDFVLDVYTTQTKTFPLLEYPLIIELIKTNKIKNVLDIGTGEGSFITGLAKCTPNVFLQQ